VKPKANDARRAGRGMAQHEIRWLQFDVHNALDVELEIVGPILVEHDDVVKWSARCASHKQRPLNVHALPLGRRGLKRVQGHVRRVANDFQDARVNLLQHAQVGRPLGAQVHLELPPRLDLLHLSSSTLAAVDASPPKFHQLRASSARRAGRR